MRRAGGVVLLLLGIQALEIAGRFPHYLAYFNGIVSPDRAYRHLVDSSLDWGQDLPGVRKYLDAHAAEGPFHLAYFGAGNPQAYGIEANFLPSQPGRFRAGRGPVIVAPIAAVTPTAAERAALARQYPAYSVVAAGTNDEGQTRAVLLRNPAAWQLTGGTYLISATLLQLPVWGEFQELNYQELRQRARPLVTPATTEEYFEALSRYGVKPAGELLVEFEVARMNRLAAFLRGYTPDASVGHSILVYRMAGADITQALEGPSPYRGLEQGRTLSAAVP